MKKLQEKKGITLISLVITVIILLILAVVAITIAVDSNGLFDKTGNAANTWNSAVAEEGQTINDMLDLMDEIIPSPMVTKWNVADGDEVTITLYYPEYDEDNNTLPNTTDVTINWGDGTTESYTSSNLQYDGNWGYVTHTYTAANSNITVTITGKCNEINIGGGHTGLIAIEEWGYTETAYYDFGACTNLATIASPEKNTFKNVTSFNSTFWRCTSLTSIPSDLFANCPNVTKFNNTFSDCTSLRSIPSNLFDNCLNVTNFEYTFANCTSLTGNAIPLWEREVDNQYGTPWGIGCYRNCTGLSNYDSIPSSWTY